MIETNSGELMEAIQRFKQRYGVYEPLDNDRLDEIILEIKEEKKAKKKKRRRS